MAAAAMIGGSNAVTAWLDGRKQLPRQRRGRTLH